MSLYKDKLTIINIMLILSIDVGIINLAMCLFDTDKQLIKEWDVSGVPPLHTDGLYKCMNNHLNDRPWVLDADTILIEKQPDKNRKMKSVEHFLQAYFVIKTPTSECIIYDARHKVPDVSGPGKARYRQRKNTAITRCKEFLESCDTNAHWLDTFKKSKKKDDLADTVMQALSFKHVEAEPKTVKKLTGREPNEHQEDTKYSVSNLVWFCKNNTDEILEKKKRFMKDLKRHYSSINELRSHI